MKGLMIVLISMFLFLSSCARNGLLPVLPDSTGKGASAKKGTAFNTNTITGLWSSDVLSLNSHWFYTWGTLMPSDPTPGKVEFVPMFWSRWNMNTGYIDSVKRLKVLGKVNFILGFNEPNRTDQANMSVQDALAFWPALESIGLPLGSPAVDWPTRPWFDEFMKGVAQNHLRVDFICVHMYTGPDDEAFVQVLEALYLKYHLPVWITEFGIADWSAASVAGNKYTSAQALSFMQRLLPKLEALPFVKRYSWFSGYPDNPALWPSALIDARGRLTPLGAWYGTFKP